MLIKKLAVPLINEKILLQAEHCTIATASISDSGFDFIAGRLSTKCKVELMTSLDGATSPSVLTRISKHFSDRVTLKIYHKNTFHANLFVFDLPFRKSVAFVGSGSMTLRGLKDDEEIFWKVTDPKEIESLRSWFVGYYEYASPITENVIREYDLAYPLIRQREIASAQERQEVVELTMRGFSWDAVKFKNQFFQKDDYLVFSNSKSSLNDVETIKAREAVKEKLLELHGRIKRDITLLKLHEPTDSSGLVSSVQTKDHPDERVRSMSIAYGRREADLKVYREDATLHDFMTLQFVIRQKDTCLLLAVGKPNGSREDREHIRHQMNFPEYRETLLKLLQSIGSGYWIEIAGDRRPVDSFPTPDALWEFTKGDDWRFYAFMIGQSYAPGGLALTTDMLPTTVAKEFEKLMPVYEHLKVSPAN